jgi:hypothetical protein
MTEDRKQMTERFYFGFWIEIKNARQLHYCLMKSFRVIEVEGREVMAEVLGHMVHGVR